MRPWLSVMATSQASLATLVIAIICSCELRRSIVPVHCHFASLQFNPLTCKASFPSVHWIDCCCFCCDSECSKCHQVNLLECSGIGLSIVRRSNRQVYLSVYADPTCATVIHARAPFTKAQLTIYCSLSGSDIKWLAFTIPIHTADSSRVHESRMISGVAVILFLSMHAATYSHWPFAIPCLRSDAVDSVRLGYRSCIANLLYTQLPISSMGG